MSLKVLTIPTTGIYKNMEFEDLNALINWVESDCEDGASMYGGINNGEAPFEGIRAVYVDRPNDDRPTNLLGLRGNTAFVNFDVNGDVRGLTEQQIRDIRLSLSLMFMRKVGEM